MKTIRAVNTSVKADAEITKKLESLSTQQQEFIQRIFDRPRDYVLLSLRQVARKLGVDPSTLLRWLHALGFRQYADFRTYLHERAITQATSLDAIEKDSRHTGLAGQVGNSIECDLKNLNALQAAIDPVRLVTAAKKVWKARRIIILAGDMCASLGLYFEYALSMIGLDAINTSTPGEMVHRTRSVRENDVVVAITYGRGHTYTVAALAQASHKGAYCIGISDSYLSPIVDMCHEFFITPTDRVSFAISYTSAMALINAILVVITSYKKQSLYPVLQEISEEQSTGDRFYLKKRDADQS
jgi:DNA-binding MurR/RpiR family transcriptional regulator